MGKEGSRGRERGGRKRGVRRRGTEIDSCSILDISV